MRKGRPGDMADHRDRARERQMQRRAGPLRRRCSYLLPAHWCLQSQAQDMLRCSIKGTQSIFFLLDYFFFNFYFFNWRIIALQCCISFCTTSWISYMYTYINSLLSLPPSPPISTLSVITEHQAESPVLYQLLLSPFSVIPGFYTPIWQITAKTQCHWVINKTLLCSIFCKQFLSWHTWKKEWVKWYRNTGIIIRKILTLVCCR